MSRQVEKKTCKSRKRNFQIEDVDRIDRQAGEEKVDKRQIDSLNDR